VSSRPEHLPPGLTATVGDVEAELGNALAAAAGDAIFEAVEAVRRCMVRYRDADGPAASEEALDRAAATLDGLTTEQRSEVARAYTLYLQLVNVCENAYRTHRLRQAEADAAAGPRQDRAGRDRSAGRSAFDTPAGRPGARVTFVLTAHPTESRSPANIRLLRRVQDHVLASLDSGRPIDRREIRNLLQLAWLVGTHPREKPSVDDEAAHLFSLLTDPILSEWVALTEAGHEVLLRSWVGGDKDGHPGVGAEQTQASLQRSRDRLVAFVRRVCFPPLAEDVGLAAEGANNDSPEGHPDDAAEGGPADSASELEAAFAELDASLQALDRISDGDGARMGALRASIDGFQELWHAHLGVRHPAAQRLTTLLGVFPALVVPLELREERGGFASDSPIAAMMARLTEIAAGGAVAHYARAVVVSMTLDAEDLLEAQRLVDGMLGDSPLPVIPLFELPDVLERAPGILADVWRDERFREAVRARGHLEVMLGYSDTAKRMGMLASRVALHDAMRRIGEWAEAEGIRPLFFHGHGGSVGRGGGRIEDLAATWPPGARTPYKYTVQGEMVERTFASPAILRSLVEKVARVQHDPPEYRGVSDLARELARRSQAVFEERVSAPAFLELLAEATPYTRLQALTIGSRPVSRAGGGLEKLRAIPWVLCWTQVRLLLHAWLGVGNAWREVRERPGIEDALEQARAEDPLFRSYSRLLSFTLAKTEPAIWHRYRQRLAGAVAKVTAGAAEADQDLAAELDADYDAAVELACRAVGGDSLLPDRPWLEESIRYRAPMIHPLNLLQIDLLADSEWSEEEVRLFRETVTGIAAGMLTTG
jgi:phosphoenolpyruvate carboxylase